MAHIISPTKKQLLDAAKKVPSKGKKEGWVLVWDRSEDTFFYSPHNIPNGSQLFQVNDEFALYMDSKNDPTGLVIDYFNNNFMEHHASLKSLANDIFAKNKKELIEVNPEKTKGKKVAAFRDFFLTTLIAEAEGASLHD